MKKRKKERNAKMGKISQFLMDVWIRFCKQRNMKCFSGQLEYEISSLNPGKDVKKLTKEHYERKISLCLVVLAVGTCLIAVCLMAGDAQSVIYEEWYIKRDPVGGVEKIVKLDAKVGETLVSRMEIPVEEQALDEKTAQTVLEEIAEKIPACVLGENESLDHVDKPLELITTWEDLPVSILWESSDPQYLEEDGSFGEGVVSDTGRKVVLTATIYYGDMVKKVQINCRLYPPDLSEEEKVQAELKRLLKNEQEESRTEEYLHLPERLGEEEISWKEPDGSMALLLFLLVMGTIVAVFIGKDRDVHKQYEDRNNQLLLEYPEFVSRLQLFICSGMSIRSAFFKMGKEYQRSLQKGGKKKVVSEELLLAIRKMENGMSETEALDYFGRRCHLYSYKKMVSLIRQNLKRGADGLREALMNETRMAFEERKQSARKLGEEAGTKLLLPMMMLLGVVMVIIMVPAYFSFGGLGT